MSSYGVQFGYDNKSRKEQALGEQDRDGEKDRRRDERANREREQAAANEEARRQKIAAKEGKK